MQELLANGNYAPFLAQALTPPMLGAAGMMGPQMGNAGFGQIGGQIGQGQFGQMPFGQGQYGQGLFGQGTSFGGLPGLGPQLGQVQHIAHHQQQTAATLHQLAQYIAGRIQVGQQLAATLQQIAQYSAHQVASAYQMVNLLNHLAQQCAWHAQAGGGMTAGYGSPFGGQPFGQGYSRLQ